MSFMIVVNISNGVQILVSKLCHPCIIHSVCDRVETVVLQCYASVAHFAIYHHLSNVAAVFYLCPRAFRRFLHNSCYFSVGESKIDLVDFLC